MNRNNISSWPISQQPRNRLFHLGAGSLSDAELLAIILRTGNHKATAVDLAQRLLNEFGGFRGLDRRSAAELCSVPDVGPAKTAQILATLAIGKKLATENDNIGATIDRPRDVYARLAPRLRDLTRETFVVLFLTCRHRLIKEQTIFEGTMTEAYVKPREIIREALNLAADSVIFVHNHPSYNPTPSREDREITKQLKQACIAVDISVRDHIIIAGKRYFSFADEGLL